MALEKLTESQASIRAQKMVFRKTLPAFIVRWWRIAPFVEKCGVLKDHRRQFKKSWAESAGDGTEGGERFKAGLTSLFDLEILMGALLAAVLFSVYFAVSDTSNVERFDRFQYDTLGFWVMLLGQLSCAISFTFVGSCYVCQVSIQPIHPSNIYAWSRTPATQWAMACPSYALVVLLYSGIAFCFLALIQRAGGNWLSIVIVCAPSGFLMINMIMSTTISMNVAVFSGCFGPEPVIDNDAIQHLTDRETAIVLWDKAVKQKDEHEKCPSNFYKEKRLSRQAVRSTECVISERRKSSPALDRRRSYGVDESEGSNLGDNCNTIGRMVVESVTSHEFHH